MDNSLKIQFALTQKWIEPKDAVVFGVFQGEEIPCGLGFKKETAEKEAVQLFPVFSKIKKYLALKDFSAEFGKIATLYPEDALYKRVIVCGLGKKEELDAEKLRQTAALAVAALEAMGTARASFTLFGAPSQSAQDRLTAIFEGAALALYKFDPYKKGKEDAPARISDVEFLLPEILSPEQVDALKKEELRDLVVAEAVYFARNITNQPASVVTPKFLVQTAQALAKQFPETVSFRAFGKKELGDLNMNGILAVGGGSNNEPALIVLEYKPVSAQESAPSVALVGKGVCFDSGGISLKPSENMDEMKMDMAGAAAVMAAFFAAARLGVSVPLACVIPAVENLPGSTAYRPGDIIKSASGKTIEVLNTDAEGRVILADALHFAASQLKPAYLIDLATLTGACVAALGSHYAAVLGTDDELVRSLTEAGIKTGEKLWALPLDDVYKKQIESDIADVKNIGGKTAGVITAALFLKEFVGGHNKYAHIDIAGTAMLSEKQGYKPKGGSGFGVRLLVEFLENIR
ncbi:leucyl aminopeptidase [Candidatus Azambacteria bacterium]|nr:leucyl aminopeptidase [Candidatus Azambacteria bacterium]MBI3685662.1 leucyl aminopeptidase [Candidatus Azambacteria bacterium]